MAEGENPGSNILYWTARAIFKNLFDFNILIERMEGTQIAHIAGPKPAARMKEPSYGVTYTGPPLYFPNRRPF